jgi:hypothetical protein
MMGFFRMDSIRIGEIREQLETESKMNKNGRKVPELLEGTCGPIGGHMWPYWKTACC